LLIFPRLGGSGFRATAGAFATRFLMAKNRWRRKNHWGHDPYSQRYRLTLIFSNAHGPRPLSVLQLPTSKWGCTSLLLWLLFIFLFVLTPSVSPLPRGYFCVFNRGTVGYVRSNPHGPSWLREEETR